MKKHTYNWYAKKLGISLRTAQRLGKSELQNRLEDSLENFHSNFSEEIQTFYLEDLRDFDEYVVNRESRQLGILLLNKVLKRLNALVDHDACFQNFRYSYFLLKIATFIRGND